MSHERWIAAEIVDGVLELRPGAGGAVREMFMDDRSGAIDLIRENGIEYVTPDRRVSERIGTVRTIVIVYADGEKTRFRPSLISSRGWEPVVPALEAV